MSHLWGNMLFENPAIFKIWSFDAFKSKFVSNFMARKILVRFDFNF